MAKLTQLDKLDKIRTAQEWDVTMLDSEYVTSTTPMKWCCNSCNGDFVRTYERMQLAKFKGCAECASKSHQHTTKQMLSHGINHVREFVSEHGCTLLSTEYHNQNEVLRIKCGCGTTFTRTFQLFKKNKHKSCGECANKIPWTTESVAAYATSVNSALIGEYIPGGTKNRFMCASGCGTTVKATLRDFINSTHLCKCCSSLARGQKHKNKISIAAVKQYVDNTDCKLISTSIKSITKPLTFECKCGTKYEQSFVVFRSRTVNQCSNCADGITPEQKALLIESNLKQMHIEDKKTLSQIASELNVSNQTVSNRFAEYDIPIVQWVGPSAGEKEVLDFVISLVGEHTVISNDRTIIPPYELDIYIPDYNVAIEYCGLYWHSEAKKSKTTYHKHKFTACDKLGIRLLTIYEDEWNDKKDIVQSTISHILHQHKQKTYARKLKVCVVDRNTKKSFLRQYHIQGDGRGSVWYGLRDSNDELKAVVGFIRYGNDWMLNRFCTDGSVIGGFSKLLSHFKSNVDWDNIYTFADNRWSVGHLYANNGFELDKVLLPDYQYVKNGIRSHKFGFRHNKLKTKLPNYDSSLSETENCSNANYYKIWDCGKYRFVLNNKLK